MARTIIICIQTFLLPKKEFFNINTKAQNKNPSENQKGFIILDNSKII
jgi:hypothetical protein